MRAEFEVVNLRLDQLPFGLRLLLPNTSYNTDHISDPRKHEGIYTHEGAGTCAIDIRQCPLIHSVLPWR